MTFRNFEVLNERKRHYRSFDDDTITSLREYYGLESYGELLQYVKKQLVKGDSMD